MDDCTSFFTKTKTSIEGFRNNDSSLQFIPVKISLTELLKNSPELLQRKSFKVLSGSLGPAVFFLSTTIIPNGRRL